MIRICNIEDINWMVNLSHEKRLVYSMVQPNFWKMAEDSDVVQAEYFQSELGKDEVIAICDEKKHGFIIGKLVNPPEVYDAGLTLMIDDFCVQSDDLWKNLGEELLQECIKLGKAKGAKQVLVVSGSHDKEKKNLLAKMNLSVASNWYTRVI